MELKQLRQKSADELKAHLLELRKERFSLRMQQVTGQLRCGGGAAFLAVDGLHGQCPDGQRFAVIIGRAGDLQCVGVFLQVPGKGSKSIPQEETHGKPRGV